MIDEAIRTKIKKAVIKIACLNSISVETFPLILATSVALVVAYLKTVNLNMTNFYERAIGHASINGADAPMRVTAFWACLAIFVLSFMLESFIIGRTKNYLVSKFREHPFTLEKTLFFEFGILLFLNELIFFYVFRDNKSNLSPILPFVFVFGAICLHALISVFRAYKNLPTETPLQSALAF